MAQFLNSSDGEETAADTLHDHSVQEATTCRIAHLVSKALMA